MAEKNYLSSSQESLPLSEESCMFLLNQLGTPLDEFINNVNAANVTGNQEHPVMEEKTNAPTNVEYPVMEQMTNLYSSLELRPQFLLEDIPQEQIKAEQIKAPSSLPATENWPGDFHFNVTFRVQENLKGAQCVYSKLKNKLYVGKDVPCPINFSTNTMMTDDVCIRAMALFSSADHASQIVHRCVNHSMSELSRRLPEAEHLVRCESSSSLYLTDPSTGRHSVIVPFENPPAGQQFSSYIYKFACFTSCSGGPNRRPLMLVFTLEKGGSVIGRQKVDLKICACPARDMKSDEKQLNSELPLEKKAVKRENPDVANDLPSKRMNLGAAPSTAYSDTVPNYHSAVKKMRPVPEIGPYNITVQDKSCYEFLKLMKRCFLHFLINSRNGNQQHPRSGSSLLNFIQYYVSSSEDEGGN